jgi:hypothetical protein
MTFYGIAVLITNNFFLGLGAMFLGFYLIRKFIQPISGNYNSSNENWTNEESSNSLCNSNYPTYNPTTGLRMLGDCAGGVDIGGNNWCE